MPHTYLRQHDIERALLALGVGDVARLHGVVVHRISDWTWSVNGGPEELLLVTLDRLARAAGWRADGRGEAQP